MEDGSEGAGRPAKAVSPVGCFGMSGARTVGKTAALSAPRRPSQILHPLSAVSRSASQTMPTTLFLTAASTWLACLAAAIAAGGAWLVRGTTAVPAATWAVAAAVGLAAEMAARSRGGLSDPAAAAAARLCVVALGLCPTMSLLGAKRPQHGVWQLIVATLAVVLVLPAASATWVRPGSLPDVHLIEQCFMPALILVGWLNFVGTRRAAAATCVAVGQGLLTRGFLPGAPTAAWLTAPSAAPIDAVACGLVVVGAGLAAGLAIAGQAAAVPREKAAAAGLAAAVDPAFLALRETFGAAWTLRIMERFDTLAAARGWPCRLRFTGLVTDTAPDGPAAGRHAPADWTRDARRALAALLRRFVTSDWLVRHGWPVTADGGLDADPVEDD